MGGSVRKVLKTISVVGMLTLKDKKDKPGQDGAGDGDESAEAREKFSAAERKRRRTMSGTRHSVGGGLGSAQISNEVLG